MGPRGPVNQSRGRGTGAGQAGFKESPVLFLESSLFASCASPGRLRGHPVNLALAGSREPVVRNSPPGGRQPVVRPRGAGGAQGHIFSPYLVMWWASSPSRALICQDLMRNPKRI